MGGPTPAMWISWKSINQFKTATRIIYIIFVIGDHQNGDYPYIHYSLHSEVRSVNSVTKCTALAINMQLFGRWYGRAAQCYAVHKMYSFLVQLYGCTVKNSIFCFFALKTDFLRLSWLEVWIFFCYSQFWAEGAILVVKCWSYIGRWYRSHNTKFQITLTYEKIVMLFFEIFQYWYFKTVYRYF